MKLLYSNEISPLLCQLLNTERNATETADEIRTAHKLAGPVLAEALYPLILDAEKIRQRLSALTGAAREEGK